MSRSRRRAAVALSRAAFRRGAVGPRRLGRPSHGVSAALARSAKAERPRHVDDLTDAIMEDYQFALVVRAVTAHLMSVPVAVVPDPQARTFDARAAELGKSLTKLWDRSVTTMARSFVKGRVAFEKVWGHGRRSGLTSIRKLEPLPMKATSMRRDEEGRFDGIDLEVKGSDAIPIGVGESWWLAIDATADAPHGRSRLLGAPYREWERRQPLRDAQAVHQQKYMLRGPRIRGPESGVDDQGNSFRYADAIKSAYRAYDVGDVLYVPDQRDADGNFTVDFEEPPEVSDPGPIETAVDKSDVRVVRSFGISELALMQTGDVGSYAMAETHVRTLLAVVQEVLQQIAESFGEYVVAPASALNFGDDDLLTVDHPDLTQLPDSVVVELAKQLIASPVLTPGQEALDIEQVLDEAGIPVIENARAAMLVANERQRSLAIAVAPETADRNLTAAPTGLSQSVSVDLPEAGLPADPLGALRPPPELPDELPNFDDLQDAAKVEIAGLWADIRVEIERNGRVTPRADALLEELTETEEKYAHALRLLGMASLWAPESGLQPGGQTIDDARDDAALPTRLQAGLRGP
ncbi:MAG: hypothetical protein AAGJ97_00455 [Planctomycetota bacterium]